jgi:uncharacterized protein (DUF1810 family)
MTDAYDFQRFLDAQAPIYPAAIEALRTGAIAPAWAAILFPPLSLPDIDAGGFAISSVDEADAFLDHPLLGGRYRGAVAAIETRADVDAADVFGPNGVDTLHSSLTVFSLATAEPVVRAMLGTWFGGLRHDPTIAALGDDW